MSSPGKYPIKPKIHMKPHKSPSPSHTPHITKLPIVTKLKTRINSTNHSPINPHNKYLTRKDYANRLAMENNKKQLQRIQLQKSHEIEQHMPPTNPPPEEEQEINKPIPTAPSLSIKPQLDLDSFTLAKSFWEDRQKDNGALTTLYFKDMEINTRLYKDFIKQYPKESQSNSAMSLLTKELQCDYEKRVKKYNNSLIFDIIFDDKEETQQEEEKDTTVNTPNENENNRKSINDQSISYNKRCSKCEAITSPKRDSFPLNKTINSSTSNLSIKLSSACNFQVLSSSPSPSPSPSPLKPVPTIKDIPPNNPSICLSDSINDITITSFNTNSILDNSSSFEDLYNNN